MVYHSFIIIIIRTKRTELFMKIGPEHTFVNYSTDMECLYRSLLYVAIISEVSFLCQAPLYCCKPNAVRFAASTITLLMQFQNIEEIHRVVVYEFSFILSTLFVEVSLFYGSRYSSHRTLVPKPQTYLIYAGWSWGRFKRIYRIWLRI